jgi:hypothetical protein
LFWGDKGGEHRFKSICNKLGDNFEDDIAMGNGVKFLRIINILLFWDNGKEGGIEGGKEIGMRAGVFYHFPNIPFDYRPASLKEICGYVIWTRRRIFGHVENHMFDLLEGSRTHEGFVLLRGD